MQDGPLPLGSQFVNGCTCNPPTFDLGQRWIHRQRAEEAHALMKCSDHRRSYEKDIVLLTNLHMSK